MPKTYDSYGKLLLLHLLAMKERPNSMLILCFWNENVKRVFVDHSQNISSAKGKQTNSKLAQIEFQVSAYLFKFIYQ